MPSDRLCGTHLASTLHHYAKNERETSPKRARKADPENEDEAEATLCEERQAQEEEEGLSI